MSYEVQFFDGDYSARQAKANEWGADAYVCHHFNAIENDNQDTQDDNATLCIVGSNASSTSEKWAALYCKKISEHFGTRNRGVVRRKRGERGDICVRKTDMPAILPEPLFVSDISQAEIAFSDEGQQHLGRLLAESIKEIFPDHGMDGKEIVIKIAFSIGHMGKDNRPNDRGAAVVGHPHSSEAELARKSLIAASTWLSKKSVLVPRDKKQIEIKIDDEFWTGEIYRVNTD